MEFDQPYELLQRENGIFRAMAHQNSKEEVERLTKVAKDSYIKIDDGDTPSHLPSKDSEVKRDDDVPSDSPCSEIVIKIDGIQNDNDDEDRYGTMNNGYSKDS